jgi:hypothetical protein
VPGCDTVYSGSHLSFSVTNGSLVGEASPTSIVAETMPGPTGESSQYRPALMLFWVLGVVGDASFPAMPNVLLVFCFRIYISRTSKFSAFSGSAF